MNPRLALLSVGLTLSLAFFAPVAHAVDQSQYEWQGAFLMPGTDGSSCTTPGTQCSTVIEKSPTTYPSSSACYNGINSAKDQNYPNRQLVVTDPPQFSCNCNQPISQQSGCQDYVAPTTPPPPSQPTPPPTSPTTPSSPASPTNSTNPSTQPTTGQSVSLENPLGSGTSLSSFLSNILSIVVRIGTIVIVLMLVYVGFKFVTAQGNESALTEARRALMWTIVGALILLGAQAIASGIQATASALSTG